MIYIKSLHIENYKCYENVDVEFNNSTNIIVGNNEAGKSTILEALNYLFFWNSIKNSVRIP